MTTKILAIDDSKTMRLAIKITFAAEDADVTSVSKGSDAVARAKQMGADVVLVDAALAGGEPSGYEVCRALKSDASTANIPVVLLVNGQEGVDQAQLTEVGGDDWLGKPFDTQELIDKVAAVKGKGAAKPTGMAKPAAAASKPAVAPPPSSAAAAARGANRTQMGMPSPNPPATAKPAARPTPAKSTPSRPAASKPTAASKPARAVAPPPSAGPATAASKPAAARPAARPAASDGVIPIAIPIPFTAADSPTPGMLERIQQAAGAGEVDPRVAEALASLSREVVERIVWEVVPELAESIIKNAQSRSA